MAATAPEILQSGIDAMAQRAAVRDLPGGERSMRRAVLAFNALTGQSLTETEGWLMMAVLKIARATAGNHHIDDYVDLSAYAALAGESAELMQTQQPKQYSVPNCDCQQCKPRAPR